MLCCRLNLVSYKQTFEPSVNFRTLFKKLGAISRLKVVAAGLMWSDTQCLKAVAARCNEVSSPFIISMSLW